MMALETPAARCAGAFGGLGQVEVAARSLLNEVELVQIHIEYCLKDCIIMLQSSKQTDHTLGNFQIGGLFAGDLCHQGRHAGSSPMAVCTWN